MDRLIGWILFVLGAIIALGLTTVAVHPYPGPSIMESCLCGGTVMVLGLFMLMTKPVKR